MATGGVVERGRRTLRAAPVALTYVGVCAVVLLVADLSSAGVRHRLVAETSTNIGNLSRGRVDTLVTSAGVVVGTSWAVLTVFAAVLVVAERRLGARRAAGVFVAGHVGATVVVAAVLAVGLRSGAFSPALRSAPDVGMSYGVMAVAGFLAATGSRRQRRALLAAAAVVLLVPLLRATGFGDWGHLVSWAIGMLLAAVPAARPRAAVGPGQPAGTRERPAAPSRTEPVHAGA